jgi:hypothetical protein
MARQVDRLRVLDIRKLRKRSGKHLDGNGLALQVMGATASWTLRYTFRGRTREMGLGPLDTVGLAKARRLAKKARELIADGHDPIEVRRDREREERAKSANRIEFQVYARKYIDDHKSKWRSPVHRSQWLTSLEQYIFPRFGRKDIAAVTRKDVLDALKADWEAKTETMSRIQGRLSNIFDAAVADELRADNPAAWSILKFKLPSPRTLKRQRTAISPRSKSISCPSSWTGCGSARGSRQRRSNY